MLDVSVGLYIVCYRCTGEHLCFFLYIPVVFILFLVSLLRMTIMFFGQVILKYICLCA